MSTDLPPLRGAFPDALKHLLEQYPRDIWDTHDNFGDLTRFWLDRHLMFRRLLDSLRTELEAHLDQKMSHHDYQRRLSRLGGMLVGELQMHHQVEDYHYFPRLLRLQPDLAVGFELLEADHDALDTHLHSFTTRANAVIAGGAAGSLDEELRTLHRLLDQHLVDEEDLIVPVILKHGEVQLG